MHSAGDAYRHRPADSGHAAFIQIAEGFAFGAAQVAGDISSYGAAHLDGHGCHSWQRMAVAASKRSQVTDHENFRMLRQAAIGLNDHPSGAVERHSERSPQRRSLHACRHSTREAEIFSFPTITACGSMAVTMAPVRTSTPNFR